MFKLDIVIFNLLYNECRNLGAVFGYGATEGFVLFLGLFTTVILKATQTRKAKR